MYCFLGQNDNIGLLVPSMQNLMLEFLAITTVIVLAVISPGPDFALVSRNALQYSQKVGMMTALGIAVGTLFHGTYCVLGYAVLLAKSPIAFQILKYIGAAYLIYLGTKSLLEKKPTFSSAIHSSQTLPPLTPLDAFWQGLLCNILNPKTVLFFLALFTMMIGPSMPLLKQMGYALEIAVLAWIWFSFLSIILSHPKVKAVLGKFQYYVTKLLGGFLVVFGIKIATMV